ncbi:MAG: hypothetical protein JNL74_10650, partial [Fibrobacteres bacterium]|nr:hypothetical protein [Fibrobacterota bacterium]
GSIRDTVIMYVRPTGLTSADQQFTSLTDVEMFKSQMKPATAFTSLDRCLSQIIMLENGVSHSQLRLWPNNDTAMGHTRAVLSRFYNIRMLPGEYRTNCGDKAQTAYRYLPWNVVYSPGWERGIKVESHYSNPESLCVVNLELGDYENNFGEGVGVLRGNNLFRLWQPVSRGGSVSNTTRRIERWYPVFSHVEFNRLKITSIPFSPETQVAPTVFTKGPGVDIVGLRFLNNLFYSVDSLDENRDNNNSLTSRRVSGMLYGRGISVGGTLDNIIYAGNIFHRMVRLFTQGNKTSKMDYSGGMMYYNNTFFKWRYGKYDNGINDKWAHEGLLSKVTYINNIADSAATPYSGWGTSNAGYLLNDSAKNIFALNNTFQWLDIVPHGSSLHKIAITSPAASGGADVISLDSVWRSDFYGVKTSGSRHRGACVPAPSNPLALQLSLDTLYTPGFRTVKVKILNKGALAGDVDTIRIFRDTSFFIRNPYKSADKAYTSASTPDSYYSANVPKSYYYFTVVVGVKQSNGNVSWSNIDPVMNGAMIKLPDAYPPQFGFSISDTLNGTRIGADSLRLRIYSPFSRGQSRENDLKKVWVFSGTDSSAIVNAFSSHDTLSSYSSYSYISSIHPLGYPIYADTSDTIVFAGLAENTTYYIAAVSTDSANNFCTKDTVIKYMSSFKTKQAPANVLRISADTIAGDPQRISVTISGFSALSSIPKIDSANVRLFVRFTNYVFNGSSRPNNVSFRDSVINIKGGLASGKWVGVINQIPVNPSTKDTTVYLSVSVASADGYYSRIAMDTNTFFIRTARTPDGQAINMSGVTIDAARPTDAQLLNGLYISYKLSNLDAIPQRDRSTMRIKVMWDTSDAYVLDPNLQISGQEILYPADLLSNETSYRVVSRGVLPGRRYHVAAFAQDTAGNWSTATRIKDTVSTPANLAKPLNRTWGLTINGYNNLRLNIPTGFFSNVTPSTIDSNDLRGIGIWILDTSVSGNGRTLNVDTLLRKGGAGLGEEHRFIFLDSAQLMALDNPERGTNQGVLDTAVLRHNKQYYIICSPLNMYNNWGSTVLETSRFYRATAFDTTLISRPPNKCQLTVTAMKDPDSVKVNWQLESNRYYDNDSLIKGYVEYDSVYLFYRTDGSYPTRVGNDSVTGVRVSAF